MNETTRTTGAVLGFVYGALLGAGVALLLAPANGRETRRKIGETARRLGDRANGELGEMKHKAIKRASVITADVKDAIDAGLTAAAKG